MKLKIGMDRAQREAYCGVRETVFQRILNLLSPLLLLAAVLVIALRWHALPQRIPIHYDFSGNVTGYGGRGTLLLLPVIGLVTDLTVGICWRFPQSWNMGIQKTSRNAPFLYHASRNMIAELRLCLALYFASSAAWQCFAPEKGMSWLVWGWALIFLPLILYLVRLTRIKRI